MIYQIATATLISINLSGSGDSPIEPISSDVVEFVIGTAPQTAEICDAYPSIVQGIDSAVDDYELSQEMVDAWALSLIEAGYDETGNSRLTLEARDVVLDWLHGCLA